MNEILIAYLAVGWFVASIAACFFTVREGETYTAGDFLRVIPLWPIVAVYALACLIMRMIEWGLDD